jgi:hypothetical protein
MPAGEPIEELSVRIVADVRPMLAGVDAAIDSVEDQLEELARRAKRSGIEGTFEEFEEAMQSLAKILEVDVSVALDKMEKASDKANVGVAALAHQMLVSEKSIKKTTSAEKKLGGAIDRTTSAQEQQKEVFALTTEEIKQFVTELAFKLDEAFGKYGRMGQKAVEEIMRQIPALQEASANTKQFKENLWKLIDAQARNIKAFQEQRTEGNKVARMFKTLGSRILVGLGVYTVAQRIFANFKRVLKEAIDLIIEAGDQTSPFVQRLKELKQESESVKLVMGAMIIPFKVWWEGIKNTALKVLVIFINKLREIASDVVPKVVARFAQFGHILGAIRDNMQHLVTFAFDFLTALASGDAAGLQRAIDNLKAGWKDLTPILEEGRDVYADTLDDMQQKTDEFLGDISSSMVNFVDLLKARLVEKIDELDKTFQTALDKVAKNTLDRLDEITKRFNRRRFDAEIDFLRDLRDMDREAENDRINALIDYQLREFRIREDFKMRLLDLENRYVLDLEDAVRERDARAVLMLQRRFNLEKAKLNAEKNLRLKRMKEDFILELREIERQRRIRKMQRILEFEEQMQDLALQEERAREDARAAALLRIRDLEEGLRERIKTLAEAFVEEYNLTADQLVQLYNLLEDYYGAGGYIEQLFEYIASVAAQTVLVPEASKLHFSDYSQERPDQPSKLHVDPSRIVNPDEPEPILGMDAAALSPGSASPAAGFGGGGLGGRMQLDLNVLADPRLVVEVVNEAMGEIADVFVQINRAQQRGR